MQPSSSTGKCFQSSLALTDVESSRLQLQKADIAVDDVEMKANHTSWTYNAPAFVTGSYADNRASQITQWPAYYDDGKGLKVSKRMTRNFDAERTTRKAPRLPDIPPVPPLTLSMSDIDKKYKKSKGYISDTPRDIGITFQGSPVKDIARRHDASDGYKRYSDVSPLDESFPRSPRNRPSRPVSPAETASTTFPRSGSTTPPKPTTVAQRAALHADVQRQKSQKAIMMRTESKDPRKERRVITEEEQAAYASRERANKERAERDRAARAVKPLKRHRGFEYRSNSRDEEVPDLSRIPPPKKSQQYWGNTEMPMSPELIPLINSEFRKDRSRRKANAILGADPNGNIGRGRSKTIGGRLKEYKEIHKAGPPSEAHFLWSMIKDWRNKSKAKKAAAAEARPLKQAYAQFDDSRLQRGRAYTTSPERRGMEGPVDNFIRNEKEKLGYRGRSKSSSNEDIDRVVGMYGNSSKSSFGSSRRQGDRYKDDQGQCKETRRRQKEAVREDARKHTDHLLKQHHTETHPHSPTYDPSATSRPLQPGYIRAGPHNERPKKEKTDREDGLESMLDRADEYMGWTSEKLHNKDRKLEESKHKKSKSSSSNDHYLYLPKTPLVLKEFAHRIHRRDSDSSDTTFFEGGALPAAADDPIRQNYENMINAAQGRRQAEEEKLRQHNQIRTEKYNARIAGSKERKLDAADPRTPGIDAWRPLSGMTSVADDPTYNGRVASKPPKIPEIPEMPKMQWRMVRASSIYPDDSVSVYGDNRRK